MATMPVIDALDHCKIALQYIAEMQSDGLSTVLELLLERLDAAIGQVHSQLRQCQCRAAPRAATPVSARRVALTVVPRPLQTPCHPALVSLEDPYAGEERPCPDA
jgi:hypothetical protein